MTRPFFFIILGIFLGVFLPSIAQSRIAIIDSQRILSSFAGAIDAQKQLEAENEKWGQELQRLDEELQRQREELERQRLVLSDAKRKEREAEIRRFAEKIQRFREEKWGENGEYFRRQEQLMRPVLEKIRQVINQVAEEDKYDLIFDTVNGNVLYAKEKYDITGTVLELLESEAVQKTPR